MKTYNIANELTVEAKAELQRIINTHDRYKKSFFWSSASSSNMRRRNEQNFIESNPDVQFITPKGVIEVIMQYSESCKNVYYSIGITLDGKPKNIMAIKSLLK